MVEDLYEEDEFGSTRPDIELEEGNSLRGRQRKRRRMRKQKQILKKTEAAAANAISALPLRENKSVRRPYSSASNASNEQKPLKTVEKSPMASGGVRFASLVDSRRISNAEIPPGPAAKRLQNLFDPPTS